MGPIRRTINLICALALSSGSAFCFVYIILYARQFNLWLPVSAAVFTFVGLSWLWADFISADPRPEK
jgi:hypothetical protein